MYPLKIKEKYDRNNLANLGHRFGTVYLWNYKSWDYNEESWSHPWVDISPVTPNQDVLAVLDWKVFKVWEDWAYWKYIFIEHENVPHPDNLSTTTTLYSCYEHLSSYGVKEWDEVKEWDIIWKTWNTWISFWEHLHFQIDKREAPFHSYWPYTWEEVRNAWVWFSEGVNLWLWKDKAKMYTVNPLVYLDQISTSAITIEKPQEVKVISSNDEKTTEVKSVEEKISTEPVKLDTIKTSTDNWVLNSDPISNNQDNKEVKKEEVVTKDVEILTDKLSNFLDSSSDDQKKN